MSEGFYSNQRFAETYCELVSREDYEHNLLPAIQKIAPLKEKDIIELGAGTGRVTSLIAPLAHRLIATDLSFPMLIYGKNHLSRLNLTNWHMSLADHRALPFASQSADVVLSGWSFHGVAIDYATGWQRILDHAMREVARVLRPGGIALLIESLGTGHETPHPPKVLVDYLGYLDCHGFEANWIRTDYFFENEAKAIDLISFFFDDDPMPMWEKDTGVIVPECTGLWWKRFE
jgi:ubiquinone/menaquinone biosynthesis C-methylase UbiE